MANSAQVANCIRVEASTQFSDVRRIRSIKFIGTTGASATIKETSSSGEVVWTESGTANVYNPEVCLHNNNGFYVTITSGAVVYLYLE